MAASDIFMFSLRSKRAWLSLALPLVVLVLLARVALDINFVALEHALANANKMVYLVALLVFYSGFIVRGVRWRSLLGGADIRIPRIAATEILFLSWFVNCIVPAKLGDVYRAHLLRINYPASGSRALGTVVIERMLDLVTVALLAAATAYLSFGDHVPAAMRDALVIGGVFVGVLVAILVTLRGFGSRVLRRLPVPARVIVMYADLETGLFSIRLRQLPFLVFWTVSAWGTEITRLSLVMVALGAVGGRLDLSAIAFTALVASLLTVVPFTPGGVGLVEAGMVGVLTVGYGVSPQMAATIAIADRLISVYSIMLFGALLYTASSKVHGTPAISRLKATALMSRPRQAQ